MRRVPSRQKTVSFTDEEFSLSRASTQWTNWTSSSRAHSSKSICKVKNTNDLGYFNQRNDKPNRSSSALPRLVTNETAFESNPYRVVFQPQVPPNTNRFEKGHSNADSLINSLIYQKLNGFARCSKIYKSKAKKK